MATIAEILRMSLEKRKQEYSVSGLSTFDNKPIGIETVIIDGYPFTDYGAFSFLLEKTYIKSPERSADGSIANLNSYATFVTPHLKIDFSLLSIDDYRVLMKMIYARNEFIVECYDIVNNKMATHKMYFTTEEMPKLWTVARALNGEEWVELLGVEEYTVEMVGTNESLEIANILYYDENGALLYSQEVQKGIDAIVNYNFVPPSGYRFDGQWKDSEGAPYRNGESVFIRFDIDRLDLYVQLVPTNQYTLSLDFGKGIKPTPMYSNERVDSFEITQGAEIGATISNKNIILADGTKFILPLEGTGVADVEYNGKTYAGSQAYYFKDWYWNPEGVGESVVSEDVYSYAFNRTLHQVYTPQTYVISFVTNVSGLSLGSMIVAYGEKVALPTLTVGGKKFKGWVWYDNNVETAFNGTMPPFSITLYAKWE